MRGKLDWPTWSAELLAPLLCGLEVRVPAELEGGMMLRFLRTGLASMERGASSSAFLCGLEVRVPAGFEGPVMLRFLRAGLANVERGASSSAFLCGLEVRVPAAPEGPMMLRFFANCMGQHGARSF